MTAGPAELAILALAVLVLGTPHGALDAREAREWLQPRLGSGWAVPFVGAYLALAALTLGAWLASPLVALVLFLALSTWHFGSHDSPSGRMVPILVRGSLAPVLAAAAHRGETEAIFALLAGEGSVTLAALLGGPLLLLWLAGAVATLFMERSAGARTELLLLAALFVLAPPLVAFALYFGLLHSPRALAASRRPGERWTAMLRAALPWSLAAVALALPLWLLLQPMLGQGPALVRTLFWWLSALTVPHMALHALSRRTSPTAAGPSWRDLPSPAKAG